MNRWEEIDLPVLGAVYELESEYRAMGRSSHYIEGALIAERAGVSTEQYERSVELLLSDGLIEAARSMTSSDVRALTPAGLRRLGEWPSPDAVANLLPQIVNELAAEIGDDPKAGVLHRGADILQGLGTSMLADVVRRVIGLS